MAEVENNNNQEVNPSQKKNELMLNILRQIQSNLNSLITLIEQGEELSPDEMRQLAMSEADAGIISQAGENSRIVEGVFNGEVMIGSDGREYVVPANYASKSKLIEGDILKLTISPEGNFIYKQIGPIERQRITGSLAYDKEKDQYRVVNGERSWHVLDASVSYFKGQAGDDVIIIVPKSAPSRWAAVENIIKK